MRPTHRYLHFDMGCCHKVLKLDIKHIQKITLMIKKFDTILYAVLILLRCQVAKKIVQITCNVVENFQSREGEFYKITNDIII